jgi:hypothetical protein
LAERAKGSEERVVLGDTVCERVHERTEVAVPFASLAIDMLQVWAVEVPLIPTSRLSSVRLNSQHQRRPLANPNLRQCLTTSKS